MSSSDAEVQELVSIATLGEGVLREADEHRILKVLLTAGFSPLEAREKVDAALRALGARRAAEPSRAAPPAAGDTPRAAPEGDEKAASPEVVQKAITRSFKKPTRRPRPEPREGSSDEVVVAELVAPAPIPDDTTRWSGLCSACLAAISTEDVRSGRAEAGPAGKRHCRACVSKLRAGLLCKVCYQPVERAALLDGRAQLHADRAVHGSCLKA